MPCFLLLAAAAGISVDLDLGVAHYLSLLVSLELAIAIEQMPLISASIWAVLVVAVHQVRAAAAAVSKPLSVPPSQFL